MKSGPDIARIAALIGDPARANMLAAMMSGHALTATELANEAGITPQTASSHLKKLTDGGLLTLRQQGRHRYFALADDTVAAALETLMGLAAGQGHLRTRPGPRDDALRTARVCYNHLAGRLGVQLYGSLVGRNFLTLSSDGIALADEGRAFVTGFGIDLATLERARAPLCRECLDWSARRSHLAGSLGRGFLTRMLEQGWATRTKGSRVITFTRNGRAAFDKAFPVGSTPPP